MVRASRCRRRRPRRRGPSRCLSWASASSSEGTGRRRSPSADLVVLSPGRAADPGSGAGGARARRSRHRGNRAGVTLAPGARHRHHRHEGEVDDDGVDGTDARSGRIQGDRRRQHRRAAERPGVGVDARDPPRGGDEQLSARADRSVPSVDCGDAELFRRPSGSTSGSRGVWGGQAPHLREPGGRRLGRDQRRRSGRAGAGAPRPGRRSACSRARPSIPEGTRRGRRAGLWSGGQTPIGVSCRSTRFICSDRISSPT